MKKFLAKIELNAVKIFYIALFGALAFFFNVSNVVSGLDASWVYAVNKFFSQGRLWGKNIIFTYGPLGWLFAFCNVDVNLTQFAFYFWCAITLLTCFTFSYALFSKKLEHLNSHVSNIFVALVFLYYAYLTGWILPEYILTILILTMLLICLNGGNNIFYWLAVFITIFSAFTKFNSGAANLALLFIFSFTAIFIRRDKIFQYMAGMISVPTIFLVIWLIYNPSLNELYFYIKGASEISTGYISAMGMPFNKPFVPGLIGYTFIFIYFVKKFAWPEIFNLKNVAITLLFLFPLCMALKHLLFVRHMVIVPALSVYLSLFILFMPLNLNVLSIKRKHTYYLFAFMFLISSNNPFTNPFVHFYDNVKSIVKVSKIVDARELKLNNDFKEAIKGKTYSIYPTELAYSFDSPENFKAMPIFQAYSAYTPWLDNLNAEFFNDDNKAPEFLIFNMGAIDGRFSLIECPSTWLAIYSHYKIKLYDPKNNIFLLERSTPKIKALKEFETREINSSEVIEIPADKFCTMRVDFKLSLFGKIMKALFYIPSVFAEIEYYDGTIEKRRVVPDNLNNDVIISNILLDMNDFEKFMNGDFNIKRVKSIRFYGANLKGAGLKCYASNLKITFSEIQPF